MLPGPGESHLSCFSLGLHHNIALDKPLNAEDHFNIHHQSFPHHPQVVSFLSSVHWFPLFTPQLTLDLHTNTVARVKQQVLVILSQLHPQTLSFLPKSPKRRESSRTVRLVFLSLMCRLSCHKDASVNYSNASHMIPRRIPERALCQGMCSPHDVTRCLASMKE